MPASLERQLLLFLILVNAVFAAAFLAWQSHQEETAVIEQMKLEARGIYHYVVLTRQLISKWGGVYIKNEEDFERKTPSGFTKALADLGREKKTLFSIKLAFNGNIDPDHMPDSFEQRAIDDMKKNRIREAWTVSQKKNHREFRYAGPLIFDSNCASCHAGSTRSGVIGCITVNLKADQFFTTLTRKQLYTALYLAVAFGVIMLLLWCFLKHFVLDPLRRLDTAARRVEQGDLNAEVTINASREWQSVGRNFNSMVHALARQQAVLKKEVEKAVSGMQAAFDELKRTEQYKTDFFTNITHDLKTPITAMQGALNLLERNCTGQGASYLEILRRNCSKLAAMVQDILDCARLESGSLELDMQPTDIAELVEDAILMAMPLAWEKNIEIRYPVPEKRCMAIIDRARMEQVMANLLSNAIKFSPQGRHLEVIISMESRPVPIHPSPGMTTHSEPEEGHSEPADRENSSKNFWIIFVKDRGQGVSAESMDVVFDKFYHRSPRGGPEGLGLGLSIVKGIVGVHGGRTGVMPRKGGGSCFWFSVPVLKREG